YATPNSVPEPVAVADGEPRMLVPAPGTIVEKPPNSSPATLPWPLPSIVHVVVESEVVPVDVSWFGVPSACRDPMPLAVIETKSVPLCGVPTAVVPSHVQSLPCVVPVSTTVFAPPVASLNV